MSTHISHGMGQMRAQSISIQVSDREKCNAGCLFCISRTTPGIQCQDDGRLNNCELDRLDDGLNYARHLGATHAILTGRADPTQEDTDYLEQIITLSRKYLPIVDMHTNGVQVQKKELLDLFYFSGLKMITFSIASFNQETNHNLMKIKQNPEKLISQAVELGLLVRCSLVVNKQGVADITDIMEYVRTAGNLGAHMVVVREVWVPETYSEMSRKVYDWNKKNQVKIKPLQDELIELAKNPKNDFGLQPRDPLPWGTPVLAVGGIFKDINHGVNLTFACCDEATTGLVIKSIVHKPNGHGYRNWDHNGDILY